MAKGKKTGGRRAGIPNKRSRARQAAFKDQAAKIEKALGKGAFEGDAHALMVATYKDATLPLALRLDAAKAAAPYEKQRLSTTTLQGPGGTPLVPGGNADQIIEEVRAMIADEMGRAGSSSAGRHPANSDQAPAGR